MLKVLVITRPSYDVTTNYLYHWSKKVLSQAEKSLYRVVDLLRERANRNELVSVIKKTKPDLICLNGHGDSQSVTGQDNDVLVSASINAYVLKDTITYALSCRSAKTLGLVAVKNGARAYIGYREDFVFMYEQPKISHPLEDKTAELFLAPAYLLMTSLIKGNKTETAYQRSQEAYRNNIKSMLTSNAGHDSTTLLPYFPTYCII